jgi:hypothetical protein
VALEAVKLLYEFAFDVLGLHRLYGPIAAENKGMPALPPGPGNETGRRPAGPLLAQRSLAGRYSDRHDRG